MGKEIIRNKYHGHIVEQVLNGDGWATKLFAVDADGKESFLQECESLGEAIGIAKKRKDSGAVPVEVAIPSPDGPSTEATETAEAAEETEATA